MANACVGLADLRNTYIVEMVAIAIGEFTQSEFHGERDVQGRLIPDKESIQCKSWLNRNKMATGSLLASGFKGTYSFRHLKGIKSNLPLAKLEQIYRLQGLILDAENYLQVSKKKDSTFELMNGY